MKKSILVAALLLGVVAQPVCAASKAKDKSKESARCTPAAAAEAEQAIRYVTDLMVASTACQNTTYAEFRLRNRDAIVAYQKALATHMRGNAAFDKWNTSLANQAAQRQANTPPAQFCQQSEPLLKQASAFDIKGFRAYAAAQAASAQHTKCAK